MSDKTVHLFATLGVAVTVLAILFCVWLIIALIKDYYIKRKFKKTTKCDFNYCKYCKSGYCQYDAHFCQYAFCNPNFHINDDGVIIK